LRPGGGNTLEISGRVRVPAPTIASGKALRIARWRQCGVGAQRDLEHREATGAQARASGTASASRSMVSTGMTGTRHDVCHLHVYEPGQLEGRAGPSQGGGVQMPPPCSALVAWVRNSANSSRPMPN